MLLTSRKTELFFQKKNSILKKFKNWLFADRLYLAKAIEAKNPEIVYCWTQAVKQIIIDTEVALQKFLKGDNNKSEASVASLTADRKTQEDTASEGDETLSNEGQTIANSEKESDVSSEQESTILNVAGYNNWARAALYLTQAIEEENAGNKDESICFKKAADYRRSKALEGANNDVESNCNYRIDAEKITQGNPAAEKAYRKSLEACEKRDEALANGYQKTAALYEEIAKILRGNQKSPGAIYAYLQVTKNKSQGNEDAARVWCECGQAYEAQADMLEKENEPIATQYVAAQYEKIAHLLGGTNQDPGVGIAYELAELTNIQLDKKDNVGWRIYAKVKVSQAAQLKMAINIHPLTMDKTIALEFEKQADNLEKEARRVEEEIAKISKNGLREARIVEANYAYEQATKSKTEGNTAAAEAWTKSAQAYEKRNEAIEEGNEITAELHQKIAQALGEGDKENSFNPGAGRAYQLAFTSEHPKLAVAYLKCAEVREEEDKALQAAIDAHVREDQVVAKLHQKRAQSLGGDFKNIGAGYAYMRAANNQSQNGEEDDIKKMIKLAEICEKESDAFQSAIGAHSQGNKIAVELHQKRAQALREDSNGIGAIAAYEAAMGHQYESRLEVAATWYKIAQVYEEKDEIIKAIIEALPKKDDVAINLYQMIEKALEEETKIYVRIGMNQLQKKDKVVAVYCKSAWCYESQIKILQSAINTHKKGNKGLVKLHEKIAKALGGDISNLGAGFAYMRAAESKDKRDERTESAWVKCAQTYEKRAESLKVALEALSNKDKATMQWYEKIAEALGGDYENPGAGITYGQAAAMQEAIKINGLESSNKGAQCYEKQAEALKAAFKAHLEGNEATTTLYKKIAKALGGNSKNPGAGMIYGQAAAVQARENMKEVAVLYIKCAEAYEKQAEAFQSTIAAFNKDKITIMVLHEKRAQTLEKAAMAYGYAVIMQTLENVKAAVSSKKSAEAYEKQSEALKISIEAHEAGKAAENAEAKAKEITPENIQAFELAWEKAINTASNAQKQWEDSINVYGCVRSFVFRVDFLGVF